MRNEERKVPGTNTSARAQRHTNTETDRERACFNVTRKWGRKWSCVLEHPLTFTLSARARALFGHKHNEMGGSETFFLEPKESMAFYRFRICCSATTGIATLSLARRKERMLWKGEKTVLPTLGWILKIDNDGWRHLNPSHQCCDPHSGQFSKLPFHPHSLFRFLSCQMGTLWHMWGLKFA